MRIHRIKRVLGTTAASLGLVVGLTGGFVGATSGSGIIDTTGPDSTNIIVKKNHNRVRVTNDNNLNLGNVNTQSAFTGRAEAVHNTHAGGAESGYATNNHRVSARVSVVNTAPTGAALVPLYAGGTMNASIRDTGPDSVNKVIEKNSTKVNVVNDNHINVTTTNVQTATTGDATVADNTHGGSAVTGDATNSSTTDLSFTVAN